MKIKKLLSSFCLAGILLSTAVPCAFAYTEQQNIMAQELYSMGLFQGKGRDKNGNLIFELDNTATRDEAITMLIRLLGAESTAKSNSYSAPFNDVESWAVPYVGYAYQNKLASGISPTKFGGKDTVNAKQYITFALRALGYTEGTDFQYSSAWDFSDQIGLTSGQYNESTKSFTRGDIVQISYNALKCNLKNEPDALIKKLYDSKAVEYISGASMDMVKKTGIVTLDQPKNLKIVRQNDRVFLTWEDNNSSARYTIYATDDLNEKFKRANYVAEKRCELAKTELYNFLPNVNHYIKIQATVYDDKTGRNHCSEYSQIVVYNPTGYVETLPDLSINDVTTKIADYVSVALEADQDMLRLCQKAELATSEDSALSYARQAQDKSSVAVSNLYEAIELCKYFSEYSDATAKFEEILDCHLRYIDYVDSSSYQTWLHTTILNCSGMGQKYNDATSMLLSGYSNYVSNHK